MGAGHYHVFTHTLGLIFACGSHFSVHVKPCVAPPQDFLHKHEVYKLITKKEREDFSAEKPAEQSVIEVCLISSPGKGGLPYVSDGALLFLVRKYMIWMCCSLRVWIRRKRGRWRLN